MYAAAAALMDGLYNGTPAMPIQHILHSSGMLLLPDVQR